MIFFRAFEELEESKVNDWGRAAHSLWDPATEIPPRCSTQHSHGFNKCHSKTKHRQSQRGLETSRPDPAIPSQSYKVHLSSNEPPRWGAFSPYEAGQMGRGTG